LSPLETVTTTRKLFSKRNIGDNAISKRNIGDNAISKGNIGDNAIREKKEGRAITSHLIYFHAKYSERVTIEQITCCCRVRWRGTGQENRTIMLESRLYAFLRLFYQQTRGEKGKISKRVLPDVESVRVLLSNLLCRVKSVAVVHRRS